MSDSGYLKCACSYCQGHLEFPAHAVGITTTCPHCGVETTLVAPAGTPTPPPPPTAARQAPVPPATGIKPVEATPSGSKLKKVLSVVWSVMAGVAVVAFVGFKLWVKFRRVERVVEIANGDSKADKPATTTATPRPAAKSMPMPAPVAPATSVVIAKGTPPERKPGEDLQVLSFEVQKAKDGNLQYVIGVVTNHSAKQFFNVKLEFELTRKDGKAGDLATDSIRNLPANAGMPFKTSIIGTAPVVGAKLAKLEGEKE